MLTNASITIFNLLPDIVNRKFVYIPHYIENVWFHKDQKTTITTGGMTSADDVKVRIPIEECSDWIPGSEFQKLTETGKNWTVQDKDLFILGKWDGGNVKKVSDITVQVWTVLSHSENFFGSSQHIRIGGGV